MVDHQWRLVAATTNQKRERKSKCERFEMKLKSNLGKMQNTAMVRWVIRRPSNIPTLDEKKNKPTVGFQ